jgi:hypothetical protein
MKLTPFEAEIVDSILWQLEGLRLGRVKEKATRRILRATIRRIAPREITRSIAVGDEKGHCDHAIPVNCICDRILKTRPISRAKLLRILEEWNVCVQITRDEHSALRKWGLGGRMPEDWDRNNALARYKKAGIRLR